jgi:hypothetical protein
VSDMTTTVSHPTMEVTAQHDGFWPTKVAWELRGEALQLPTQRFTPHANCTRHFTTMSTDSRSLPPTDKQAGRRTGEQGRAFSRRIPLMRYRRFRNRETPGDLTSSKWLQGRRLETASSRRGETQDFVLFERGYPSVDNQRGGRVSRSYDKLMLHSTSRSSTTAAVFEYGVCRELSTREGR